MLIYLSIGLVFALYEVCAVVYSEGYRKRVIGRIGEIMNGLHKAGWNISFKRCYVIMMTLALIWVSLSWPIGIIHRITYKSILDFKNK